jgi:hypothetical protein
MKFKILMYVMVCSTLFQCSSSSEDESGVTVQNSVMKSNMYGSARPRGTWIWHTKFIEGDTADYLNFMANNGVTEIYLQYNADVAASRYALFIQNANSRNMTVQALDGASSWALPDTTGSFDALTSFVQNYNSAYPQYRFSALHLDVEPYLNDLWDSDCAGAIESYQNFISYARDAADGIGVELCADMPFWFDGDDYTFNNSHGSGRLSEWVITTCDETALMSYRDTAQSIYDISISEVAYAQQNGKRCMVGIQTAADEAGYLTFYEEGLTTMYSVLADAETKLSSYSNWGFAIHYLSSWMELEQNASAAKWDFDNNVTDMTLKGNNGVIVGTTGSYVDSPFRKSYSFTGSNYIQIPQYANFNGEASFTIEAWIYPTAYSYCDPIISKVNPNRDFVFQLDSSGKLNVHFAINYNVYYHCQSSETIPLNKWSFVAAVWTGSKWQLYLNGQLIKERDCGGAVPAWTGTRMGIGTMNYQYNFLGRIDKVKIQSEAVSSSKINYDWRAGYARVLEF